MKKIPLKQLASMMAMDQAVEEHGDQINVCNDMLQHDEWPED